MKRGEKGFMDGGGFFHRCHAYPRNPLHSCVLKKGSSGCVPAMVRAEPSPNEKRLAKRRRTRGGGETVNNCSDIGGELPINTPREKKMTKEAQFSNWAPSD